jgi:hypothetical protein
MKRSLIIGGGITFVLLVLLMFYAYLTREAPNPMLIR